VKGLPCWPSEPLWDQLKNGRELKKCGVNFEHAYNPLQAEPITLYKGEDFDIAILGISLAALPDICKEIIACQPKWRAMVDHVKTVMTQAFQMWLNRDLEELGWLYPPDALLLTYVEPLSSWWNMNELIDKENWPAHYGLKDIAYWCGVLPDKPGETQAGATERARRQAIAYLKQRIEYIWPRVRRGPNNTFDWDVLIDPENRQGEARFDAQFWQANFQPTERYVQSLAGSTKYRLRTDESGYDNLFLAGDWIRIGSFDAGCIEAATMSGLQASRAICGYPERIVGEKDPWL
jgi:uncharacterized protein with NAD-binding domain and iron-sulfur cluster